MVGEGGVVAAVVGVEDQRRVQGPGLQVPDVIAPVVQHTGAWDGVLTVHGAALYLGYAGEAGEDAPARGVPQSPLHIIFFIELPVNVSVFAILTRQTCKTNTQNENTSTNMQDSMSNYAKIPRQRPSPAAELKTGQSCAILYYNCANISPMGPSMVRSAPTPLPVWPLFTTTRWRPRKYCTSPAAGYTTRDVPPMIIRSAWRI